MKVKMLIKKLQKMNPESLVVIPGYETGCNEVRSLLKRKVVKKKGEKQWWDGDYVHSDEEPDDPAIDVVFVSCLKPVKGGN